jgi:hypothetical protein
MRIGQTTDSRSSLSVSCMNIVQVLNSPFVEGSNLLIRVDTQVSSIDIVVCLPVVRQRQRDKQL